MSKKKSWRRIVIILAVFAVLATAIHYRKTVFAIFNSDTAVQINAGEIDSGTLIIGTHLIYLGSLNDKIYSIALESASDSAQEGIYYKSELAGGKWFEITDASSLADITNSGMAVSNEEIENLFITHHTQKDGITYDLRTNEKVCIFDIFPIYDLESMPELEELQLQYQMLKDSGADTEQAKHELSLLKAFFAAQTKNYVTDNYDNIMTALQAYYDELAKNGAPSDEKDVVLRVMEQVDYGRRCAVYELVLDAIDGLADNLTNVKDTDYEVNETLTTAAENCNSSVMEAMTDARGSMSTEGTTQISKLEYKYSQSLQMFAQGHSYDNCDANVQELIALYHVQNDMIVNAKAEIEILDILINNVSDVYKEQLGLGVSEEYQQAVAANSSHALLSNIINSRVSDVNAYNNELQYYIKCKTSRMENSEKAGYIKQLITDSVGFYNSIKNDEFESSLNMDVDAYVEFLKNLLIHNSSEDNMKGATAELYNQKEELEEQRLEALDKNDLDTAKKCDALIEKLDEDIAEQEKLITNKITNLEKQKSELEASGNIDSTASMYQITSLESQIAELTASLDSKSDTRSIMDIKKQINDKISAGDTSDSTVSAIENLVDSLGVFVDGGSELALLAAKDVYRDLTVKYYLEDCTQYSDIISQIENIVSESGIVTGAELTTTQALTLIDDLLGGAVDLSKLYKDSESKSLTAGAGSTTEAEERINDSDDNVEEAIVQNIADAGKDAGIVESDDMIAAIVALSEYGETNGNETLQSIAAGLASMLAASDNSNSAFFESCTDTAGEYASIESVAAYLGYRYVWNDTKKTAMLVAPQKTYSFTAFSKEVKRENDKEDTMEVQTVFNGVVYVPASYIKSEFGIYVINILSTDYSVLVSDEVIEQKQDLLDELNMKGG